MWDFKTSSQKASELVQTAHKVHDDQLVKNGQYGIQQRCNQYPFDPKIRRLKKFRSQYNVTSVLDRDRLQYFMRKELETQTIDRDFKIATQIQADRLCRGAQLRVTLCLFNYFTSFKI